MQEDKNKIKLEYRNIVNPKYWYQDGVKVGQIRYKSLKLS